MPFWAKLFQAKATEVFLAGALSSSDYSVSICHRHVQVLVRGYIHAWASKVIARHPRSL
jgi:hypothetical protein